MQNLFLQIIHIFIIFFCLIEVLSCKVNSEYVTSKDISENFYKNRLFHPRRFGKKKGTIEQIAKSLPYRKKSLIISSDWENEDYLTISFIIFLLQRLNSAMEIFDYKNYKNWKFGDVPPLEELSSDLLEVNQLPNWAKWWEQETNTNAVMSRIRKIFRTVFNTPEIFKLPDNLLSKKVCKPFLSLIYIFSKEKIHINASINNIPRKGYEKVLIERLEKNSEFEPEKEIKEEYGDSNENHASKSIQNDPLRLFKVAYHHVINVKRKRKFSSENGDSDIELLPVWWEKELDIVTAIILTIFKYQYKYKMKIINTENQRKMNGLDFKVFKKAFGQAAMCISNKSDELLENIPIWHRFGEKWQSFPQGAMIRILDNISKLSVRTKSWDIYDYIISVCLYYLLMREKLRIDWFTMGPLSGPPSSRPWRRFKIFIKKLFSSNQGLFNIKNNWI
ncbi:hypothetical protein FG386_000848 [Cryptosporidium ryanae]|uniref:uncharacterized protein n=1 Tax=Cryptosporidium ryanae TaxID=515981 RepID=UPI00351A8432|nr:hypothetical protein FG386_000848 [Cryptosporidium ryanae]